MKVLHVLDEISLRNKSIFSIAKFYKTQLKNSIVCGFNEVNQEVDYQIDKSFLNYFLYFSKLKKLILKNKFDIIHVHGLWRPIYFFSIFFAKIFNICLIVQPHGMLLSPALNSGNLFSQIIKKVLIIIYSKIFKISNFMSITKEENIEIKKYFQNSNIFNNLNPLSLKYKNIKYDVNKKKKLIFLGRINKIKNIHLSIEAFVKANLDKNIEFDIYGIEDDLSYRNYIETIIEKYKKDGFKINLLDPIDDNEKIKVISEAWCNIIISDSEVLSLSVQECMGLGTPSIVNDKLYFPSWMREKLFFTEISITKLVATIQRVFNINEIDRNILANDLKTTFDFKQQNINICEKQKEIYKKLFNSFEVKKSKIFSKFNKTLCYATSFASNLFYTAFFVIGFSLVGHPEKSAQITITSGIILLITQFLSGNSRSLILSNNNVSVDYLNSSLKFRVISSLLLIFVLLVYEPIFKSFDKFNILLIFLILITWVNENNLSYIEKINGYLFHIINTLINSLIYFIYIICFIFDTKYLNVILVYHIAYQLILFIFSVQDLKFYQKKSQSINKINLAIFSSASFVLAILVWRFLIYYNYTEEIAGLIFVALSLASFPGTICQNILAGTVLRIYNYDFYKIRLFLIIFIFLSIVYLFFYKSWQASDYVFDTNLVFFEKMLLPSLIGSIILSLSVFFRQEIINQNPKYVFKKDIIFNLIISTFPIVLIFGYGGNLIFLIYYLTSIVYFIMYAGINIKKNKY